MKRINVERRGEPENRAADQARSKAFEGGMESITDYPVYTLLMSLVFASSVALGCYWY